MAGEQGGSSGNYTGASPVQLDPATTQMFQAFALYMQQQQAVERKEALATKALQSVVGLLDQFDGKNISKYLKYYSREMELNKVPEKEMILTFELAVVPELREHIRGIIQTHGARWEDFILQLKEEYSLEDAERVTKKSFMEWVNKSNKGLVATELFREFERQFLQLSRVEKLTLENDKVELFLQSTDNELQRELELLLEDNTEDNGLTTDWRKVSEAVGILAKREYRRGKVVVRQEATPPSKIISRKQLPEPTIPISTTPVPASVATPQKDAIEELVKGMKDLQIKLAKLEEKGGTSEIKSASKQGYIQRCIWCDSMEHPRKECGDFADTLQQGVILWKDGKIALRDTGEFLKTNFGKGGMKKVLEDYISQHTMATGKATTYGIEVIREEEDGFGKHVETGDLWNHAITSMNKEEVSRQELLNTATVIRNTTGWDDPVDTMSVHAYLAKSHHEALMDMKRGRNTIEENQEEPSNKRRIQRDERGIQDKGISTPQDSRSSENRPSKSYFGNVPLPKNKWEEKIEMDKNKEKGKTVAYKLQSDIEATTDLKGVLEERVLNAKIEFTLREILGIAKKEFHDVIIDTIKRKRQLIGESAMSNVLDTTLTKEEELELAKCCINQKDQFSLDGDKDDNKGPSHYSKKHWARATTETLVKVGDLTDPVVALIDHGSEINIMSKDIYKCGRWPIDTEHGWVIRAANNTRGDLYGACPDIKVKIGDVSTEQNFFVQNNTSYPIILGQPYIIAVRMETKVLDDGSAYARIRSQDGKRAVQFLTIPANHERNRDYLRSGSLPRINEEFKDF